MQLEDITANLVASFFWMMIGFACSRIWAFYKSKFHRAYSKITYYRVIRLRFKDRGDAPYYLRHHHTLKNVSEPVYDETWCLNGARCNHKVLLEPVKLSSSGLVDAIQILPVLDRDADNHPHTKDNASLFTFSHPKPSTDLAAVGTMINGLQTEANWWYATTAQYDGQTLLLILDFTSLPFEKCPVSSVTSSLEREKITIPRQSVESQWFEERVGNDLFYLRFRNARKGDVIKFSFSLNLDEIPIIRGKTDRPMPSKMK